MQIEWEDGPIRHKDYCNVRAKNKLPWDGREFIGWDGEGTQPEVVSVLVPNLERIYEYVKQQHCSTNPDYLRKVAPHLFDLAYETPPTPQPYVLLANSKGNRIVDKNGLSTYSCFEFILEQRRLYPNSISVGFAFTYDAAQILKDLPEIKLMQLYDTNRVRWCRYNIEYRPRRWLRISHPITGRTATIYDVFGFFQSSFLTACHKYLGDDDPDLALIERGKSARDSFTFDELNDFIIPYNDAELRMLVRIMDILRQDLHNVGIDLHRWYGPGAVANQVLKQFDVKRHKGLPPPEVEDAAQYAYAGGRFEQFKLGRHEGTVYEYDIRSAYPAAAFRLPSLSAGDWELVESFEPESFGVWFIEYKARHRGNEPQPLFCRAKDGRVSFPLESTGWYWTPEAALVPDCVQYGYVWRTTTSHKPFQFVEAMYEERRKYKALGVSSERALKLALNSIYGKLAQLIGGTNNKPPTWHQLEWAGWITSYTRALIYNAILLKPEAIIAAETDAIFSTELLPLNLGEGLGEWELTTFTSITFLQSGFYYATTDEDKIVCRYRGLDRDRTTQQPMGLPYRGVLDHLHNRREGEWRTPPLSSRSTRFINIGLALRTSSVFRSWETVTKELSLDQGRGKSKRYHLRCDRCDEGKTLADCLHPMEIGGYSGVSHPHPLPWVMGVCDEAYENYLDLGEMDRWQ